jgi:hypothetical protein
MPALRAHQGQRHRRQLRGRAAGGARAVRGTVVREPCRRPRLASAAGWLAGWACLLGMCSTGGGCCQSIELSAAQRAICRLNLLNEAARSRALNKPIAAAAHGPPPQLPALHIHSPTGCSCTHAVMPEPCRMAACVPTAATAAAQQQPRPADSVSCPATPAKQQINGAELIRPAGASTTLSTRPGGALQPVPAQCHTGPASLPDTGFGQQRGRRTGPARVRVPRVRLAYTPALASCGEPDAHHGLHHCVGTRANHSCTPVHASAVLDCVVSGAASRPGGSGFGPGGRSAGAPTTPQQPPADRSAAGAAAPLQAEPTRARAAQEARSKPRQHDIFSRPYPLRGSPDIAVGWAARRWPGTHRRPPQRRPSCQGVL